VRQQWSNQSENHLFLSFYLTLLQKVRQVRLGGGVARNDFLCQFLADITGIPVHRGSNVESSVTGAAILAGVSGGWVQWTPEGKQELRKLTQSKDMVFSPAMSRDEVQKRFLLWTDACDRVKL
jgi:glycerol kinase